MSKCYLHPESEKPLSMMCDLCMLVVQEIEHSRLDVHKLQALMALDQNFAQAVAQKLNHPRTTKLCIVANPIQ